jgi:putative restriction endonuclease
LIGSALHLCAKGRNSMTREQRAAQIWPLLTFAASLRVTLTYQRLGELIGAQPRTLGSWLEPIQSYCLTKRLPALTVLVVSKSNGRPGEGFIAAVDVPGEQARVFSHDWTHTRIPTPGDLSRAVLKRPSNGIPAAKEGV